MDIRELFDIQLPIIQAPMAGVQGHRLCAAVCATGGLGSIPAGMLDAAGLRAELQALAEHVGAERARRPYNVNFFCHRLPEPDAAGEARWRDALAGYYAEFGIDPADLKPAPLRRPFCDEMADVLEYFRPAVVSFHFGLPDAALLARVKACGAKVISSATTVAEAEWLAAHGADAVIAQGLEAGGHRGCFLSADLSTQLGTFALLPQVVDAVDVPVIAAGGIGDARGVAAARALGAAGVQVGTAYLLCPETNTSAVHRAALQSDTARHTAVTNIFSGRPARGIVNRVIRELGPICDAAPAFPLAGGALAPLKAAAEGRGDGAFTSLWSGQRGCRWGDVDAAGVTRGLVVGL